LRIAWVTEGYPCNNGKVFFPMEFEHEKTMINKTPSKIVQ
jgi:hypothetical protein